jgi:hypothetical protein
MLIEAPAYLDQCTEKQFQDLIIEAAVANGWLVYHTHDSRRSQPGFPDLVLAKPGRSLCFLEVKTAKGRVSAEQGKWIETINAAGYQDVAAKVVRPADWDWIARALAS